jgi:hypothetical protein
VLRVVDYKYFVAINASCEAWGQFSVRATRELCDDCSGSGIQLAIYLHWVENVALADYNEVN